MAKRTRGSSRPGQRRPTRRQTRPSSTSTARPNQLSAPARSSEPAAAPAQDAGLTAEEQARAAELEAAMLDDEAAAEPAAVRPRGRAASERRAGPRERTRGSLAVRYADEYAYVARDLRRIAVIAVFLLTIMFGLFILQLAGVISV